MVTASTLGASSPLVGRDRELGVLRQHLDAALAGHGNLVLIGGEAGIGKTALADAICQEAIARGALRLAGRCYDLSETPAYGPWIELFKSYPSTSDLPPLPAAFSQRGTVGAVASQSALVQQVESFFHEAAAERPLVLLLDDLHWSDPASLDLLRFLARGLASLPLLILVTYRSDELTRRHPLYQLLPSLVREANAERLDLHALDAAAVRALVTARYGLPDTDTARLVAYVQARAEGNVFFLGELLRSLQERGILRRAEAAWALGDLTQTAVPTLLRQVIDGRLARLDEASQRLLAVAAIIGQEVPIGVWATVAEVDDDTLLATVEHALTARLLAEMPDGARVQFAHALVREALYEGVPAIRRRRIHQRVAEMLASLAGPDPDAVAYHFRQAGDARAISWLMQAGDRAQQLRAVSMARERYQTALALAEQGGADDGVRGWLLLRLMHMEFLRSAAASRDLLSAAEAIAPSITDPVFLAAFRFYCGYVDFHTISVQDGIRGMEAGVAAIDALSPPDRDRLDTLIRENLVNHGNIPHTTLMRHLSLIGRFSEVIAMAEPIADRAGTAPHRVPLAGIAYADLHLGLATAYTHLGRIAEARLAFARSREMYHRASVEGSLIVALDARTELMLLTLPYQSDDIAQRRQLADDADTLFRRFTERAGSDIPSAFSLPLLLIEGRWDTAWAMAESALRTVPDTRPNMWSRIAWGHLARERGDPAVAWEQVEAMLPAGTATEPGSVIYHFADSTIVLAAMLCLDADDPATAGTWLNLHDRFLAFSGAVLGRSEGQAVWSRYWLSLGDGERAYRHAQHALTHATEPRQPLALIAAHRLLGELDTVAGRHTDAMRHLHESLAIAEACEAPYERALTLLAWSEFRAATGETETARTLLDDARAMCEQLGAKPAVTRADALSVRLTAASTPSRAPTYPAGLTAREVEVLRLVATGLMNSEIAARLFLSERTVEQHLRSVYNKLGSSSRAAASAFAVQHGLME